MLSGELALGIGVVPARSHGLRLLRVPVGYLGELKTECFLRPHKNNSWYNKTMVIIPTKKCL